MDDGDGAGMLCNSMNSSYRMWNSSNNNTGGWSASQMRAVLNGKDSLLGSYATYALDADTALISCFPTVLQDNIAAKAVKSDTVYNSQTEENNATTYDKLWLFSCVELWADGGSNNSNLRTLEGTLYERSTINNVTTKNYSFMKSYNEAASTYYWWLRSSYTSNSAYVYYVNTSGDWRYSLASYTLSVAPGFCLK